MTTIASVGADRIARVFARAREQRRLAIAIYLTVGFPDRPAVGRLARAALDAGADIIELGIPFSDPIADGVTIQRASEVALRNEVTLDDCVEVARELIAERDACLILMGYMNPFSQAGDGSFDCAVHDAGDAGVAGMIIPDLPAEEAAEWQWAFDNAGVARIDMYAPTTPDDRLARLLPSARGFVYCVSLTGVTGARSGLSDEVLPFVARVRAHTTLPVVVGFGISRPEHVRALRGMADGVAVGSAAIDAVARGGADALRDLVRSLREAGAS